MLTVLVALVLQSKPFVRSPTSEAIAAEGLGGQQGKNSPCHNSHHADLRLSGFSDICPSFVMCPALLFTSVHVIICGSMMMQCYALQTAH